MSKEDKRVLEITPDVKWIGILDHDIVTFDIVMETRYGTTYNSYFIDAEKKCIVETAKEKFSQAYLEKVRQVCDPAGIEYIVLDHTEPDHSGSLAALLEIAPKATVVGSGNAIRYLNDMMDRSFKSMVVKDGDTLDLGNKTLHFIAAPNLHWPDSIYTYLEEDKLLFTCDSFGAHYCDEAMFDDQVGNYNDAFKYYFDVILKPFSKFMLKAIEKIRPLDIQAICPGHGPILRSDWQKRVNQSETIAREYLEKSEAAGKNVLITYVSAYGYTRDMASEIAKGIEENGKPIGVKLLDIENALTGEIESELTKCSALLVGSPTINQNTLLPVYKLFALISPLRDKGKLAGAFGSYGWSGEATDLIKANLKELKLDYHDRIRLKFQPGEEGSEKLRDFGREFAEKLISKN